MWIPHLARALYLAFAVILISSIFPLLPFDIGWQQHLITSVVNNTPLPLTGLALVLIDREQEKFHSRSEANTSVGDFIDGPTSEELRMWRLQRRCQCAALGFVLICLFQVLVTVRLLNQADRALAEASRQLAISSSNAGNALHSAEEPEQLKRIAVMLLPQPQQQELQALSIPEQRAKLNSRIGQASREAGLELKRVRNRNYTAILVDSLRNISLGVIFAYSFRRLNLTTMNLSGYKP